MGGHQVLLRGLHLQQARERQQQLLRRLLLKLVTGMMTIMVFQFPKVLMSILRHSTGARYRYNGTELLFSEQLSVTCRTVAEECCASLNITSAASQEVSKVLLSVTCEVLLSVRCYLVSISRACWTQTTLRCTRPGPGRAWACTPPSGW